jgi:hypothetical protein
MADATDSASRYGTHNSSNIGNYDRIRSGSGDRERNSAAAVAALTAAGEGSER